MDIRYRALDKSIRDAVKEEQVKLGYRKEVIRLYYPVESVKRMLHAEEAEQELLKGFLEAERDTLGNIAVSLDGDRYCFRLPEEASEYIHEHTPEHGFLYDFIDVIGRHGSTVEEILSVFRKYSEHVHTERLDNGEFDWLVYFQDGEPDDYRYCLKDEGHHVIYHRFTPEDYEALGISMVKTYSHEEAWRELGL